MYLRLLEKAFDIDDYSMPGPVQTDCEKIENCLAESEEKFRKWDIAYIKKNFPQARFRKIKNVGHGADMMKGK